MDIQGKNVLVLGGAGMVGVAVCRELLPHAPARLLVAARRRARAVAAVEQLRSESTSIQGQPGAHGATRIEARWGDVMMRAAWQREEGGVRAAVLADPKKRQRLVADVLEPFDESIADASLLVQLVCGTGAADGAPADVVIDCMNTATAVSYQNVYARARRLAELSVADARDEGDEVDIDWPAEVTPLLSALYVPQLVRHIQLLHEAMRRAGTAAYLKVGTSGTGGMGFNIPYTHGEEKPSRLLLSKAAVAGAQTALTFLMARTPGGPSLVKEVKPSALIGWRSVDHGTVLEGGRPISLRDCPPADAVAARDPANLAPEGDFGRATGQELTGVYIDTGENGLYSADEFATITALGQMQLITPEEIARDVVREIRGAAPGRDVVAALDGSVMGPSFRGGYLRETALRRLRELEREHGPAVAYEQLGPPRVSKLLFEAHLLRTAAGTLDAALGTEPAALGAMLEHVVSSEHTLRQRILTIGIPILLPDGERLLRGPRIKAVDADHGFVDLTSDNMARWQARLRELREQCARKRAGDASSQLDRVTSAGQPGSAEPDFFEPSDLVSFVLIHEEGGSRDKD